MKKYVDTIFGATKVGILQGVGASAVGKVGGSMAGFDVMNKMMPVAINVSMTKNIVDDLKKMNKRR